MTLIATKNEDELKIANKIESLETFTFSELYGGDDSLYRVADKMLQKYRKKGYISFERQGRFLVWSMTAVGNEALKGGDA